MSSNIYISRICEFCRKEFTARTTKTRFCSDKCAKYSYKQRQRDKKIEESNKGTAETLVAPLVELQAKEFLSVEDVCKLVGVSRWTVSRAVNDNRLKATRLGRRIVITRAELNRFFNVGAQ